MNEETPTNKLLDGIQPPLFGSTTTTIKNADEVREFMLGKEPQFTYETLWDCDQLAVRKALGKMLEDDRYAVVEYNIDTTKGIRRLIFTVEESCDAMTRVCRATCKTNDGYADVTVKDDAEV